MRHEESCEQPITIEYNGKTYRGSRIVEGSRKLTQTIYFGPHSKYDGRGYRPGEDAYMMGIAEILLRELVVGNPDR